MSEKKHKRITLERKDFDTLIAMGVIPSDLPEDAFDAVKQAVERTQLDPFARQIWFQYRWSTDAGRRTMIPCATVDGMRLIVERTGNYSGQLGPEYSGKANDYEWKDIWPYSEAPEFCRVAILRKDFSEPLWAVIKTVEFEGNSPIWRERPFHMVGVAAERVALRRSAPAELSGIYGEDELEVMDKLTPAEQAAKDLGTDAGPKEGEPEKPPQQEKPKEPSAREKISKERQEMRKQYNILDDPNPTKRFAEYMKRWSVDELTARNIVAKANHTKPAKIDFKKMRLKELQEALVDIAIHVNHTKGQKQEKPKPKPQKKPTDGAITTDQYEDFKKRLLAAIPEGAAMPGDLLTKVDDWAKAIFANRKPHVTQLQEVAGFLRDYLSEDLKADLRKLPEPKGAIGGA